MSKKYNYFYKITNNLNGHFYYGIHSTNNLNDGYMGSGKRLKYAYEKYGIENFSKEILKFFNTRSEAYKYEGEIVTESLASNDSCYNCTIGGVGNSYGTNGLIPVYEEGSKEISLVTKEEFFANRSKYRTPKEGKTTVFNEEGEKVTISTEEYKNNKDKYTSINFNKCNYKDKSGRIYWLDVNSELIESLSLVKICPWKGKKLSQETKDKIRKHHIETKHQKGEKNSQFGKIWITKDGDNKSIFDDELDVYLSNGWMKGRKCNEAQKKFFLTVNEVKEYREKGLSWKDIADIGGVSDITVRRFAKKNNIQ